MFLHDMIMAEHITYIKKHSHFSVCLRNEAPGTEQHCHQGSLLDFLHGVRGQRVCGWKLPSRIKG